MVKQHNQLMLALFALADLAVTAAAGAGSYGLAAVAGWLPGQQAARQWPALLALVLVLTPLVFSRCELYRPRRTATIISEWADLLRACLLVWLLTAAVGSFLLPGRHLLAVLGVFGPAWFAAMAAFRTAARAFLRWARRRGWNLRSAAIVGAGHSAQALLEEIHSNPWTGFRVCYVVADEDIGGKLMGVEVVGPIRELRACFQRRPVEFVFVALPAEQARQTEQVLNALAGVVTDVCVVPDVLGYHFLRHRVDQVGTVPVVSLTHTPQEGWNCLLKRAMDIVGALVGLVVFAPLMAIIAAAIKLTSRGPVFYLQTRTSLGGRPFRMIKFRTMVPQAEAHTGAVMASPDDARVTRLGRLLRRRSLDELPQLFNVLLGQMSLVGPRPERPELIEQLKEQVPRYLLRQQVKAGITGWAQVNGLRGKTSIAKRVEYDVHYINNWSLAFDLRILLLTVLRGFTSPNAY